MCGEFNANCLTFFLMTWWFAKMAHGLFALSQVWISGLQHCCTIALGKQLPYPSVGLSSFNCTLHLLIVEDSASMLLLAMSRQGSVQFRCSNTSYKRKENKKIKKEKGGKKRKRRKKRKENVAQVIHYHFSLNCMVLKLIDKSCIKGKDKSQSECGSLLL